MGNVRVKKQLGTHQNKTKGAAMPQRSGIRVDRQHQSETFDTDH